MSGIKAVNQAKTVELTNFSLLLMLSGRSLPLSLRLRLLDFGGIFVVQAAGIMTNLSKRTNQCCHWEYPMALHNVCDGRGEWAMCL